MRSRWLAILVLVISAACTTVLTEDEGASTGEGAGAGEDFGEGSDEGGGSGSDDGGGGDPGGGSGEETTPPEATDKCIDDEDFIGADGNVHLEPGACELVDDTSKCCLDVTGTKWVCTGGTEFPGVLDVYDYAQYPCPGL